MHSSGACFLGILDTKVIPGCGLQSGEIVSYCCAQFGIFATTQRRKAPNSDAATLVVYHQRYRKVALVNPKLEIAVLTHGGLKASTFRNDYNSEG